MKRIEYLVAHLLALVLASIGWRLLQTANVLLTTAQAIARLED